MVIFSLKIKNFFYCRLLVLLWGFPSRVIFSTVEKSELILGKIRDGAEDRINTLTKKFYKQKE
ncbi:hypothetical protein A994_01730 [Methanobacterium formicicum DSM 3637]|uniref:Uncharacterized protein n=1 Tax=Methanobacterium formicicum (strain DSM 3637 / PP1) TaxID=1204725 RepID=K2QFW3_METFP|nr:hypothetical protein A994_01730 [Methanobacterium formicicum DSM 3637]